MQGYTYSVFSTAAIASHLSFNFRLLTGRGEVTVHGARYRGFLIGVLAYYIADATWGMFAGLGWLNCLYVETVFFFLSLVAFAFMWCRFVVVYLDFGKPSSRVLTWCGYALFAFNVVALSVNPFNNCIYYIDADGAYRTGCLRDVAICLLAAYTVMTAIFVLVKAVESRGSVRRRSMMVLMFCISIAVAIVLQVIWPLTPFTSLGCLIGTCFLHVFVVQDEQAAKHTAELEDALARAHAAEKARRMFFSIVSHDIRTPLNAILGYSELLQDSGASQVDKDEALKSIRASGTTLLQLVNDVLDLAKMDSGKMTFHLGPVRLARLTDEVFASFRMAAEWKGVELVNRAIGVPTVLLDEHRFRQILFNLVGNAVKFTDRGSVTVAASYDSANLEVSVSDTGCGIPPDMLSHILEPFFQVQDPSHAADRAAGTGLGLSICKQVVEAMGGRLAVESTLGKGSTFTVYVPGVSAGTERKAVADRRDAAAVEVKLPNRILVVDDSPVNRAVLTAHLKKAGVTSVDRACDGVDAFAKLASAAEAGSPYDFVFSDFWMPNMNGLELIEKLRTDSRFRRLPVFAVTADTEYDGDPRSGLFDGILLKPLTYDKLMDVLTASGCG